jgi:light-regulated signal transduction histidine kinase (bacteriophytochrome)
MERRHPGSEGCVLTHELNNDLRVILRRCALLEERALDTESNKHVRFIRAAAEDMTERIARRPCEYAQPRRRVG